MGYLNVAQNLEEFAEEFNLLMGEYKVDFMRLDSNSVDCIINKYQARIALDDSNNDSINFGVKIGDNLISLRSKLHFRGTKVTHFAKLCAARLKYTLGVRNMCDIRPAILDTICMNVAKALDTYTYTFVDSEHCVFDDFEIILGSDNIVCCSKGGVELGDLEVHVDNPSITEASKFIIRCINEEIDGFVKNYIKDFDAFSNLVENYVYKLGIDAIFKVDGSSVSIKKYGEPLYVSVEQLANDYKCSITSTGENFSLSEFYYKDFNNGGNAVLFKLVKCAIASLVNKCITNDLYKLLKIRDYFSEQIGADRVSQIDYKGIEPVFKVDNKYEIIAGKRKFSLYVDSEWNSIGVDEASSPEKLKAFEDSCLASMESGARHGKNTNEVKYYDDRFFNLVLIPTAKKRGIEINIVDKTNKGVELKVGHTSFIFDFLDASDLKITVKGKPKGYQLSKILFDYDSLKNNEKPPYETKVDIIVDIIAYYNGDRTNDNVKDNIVKLYNFTSDIVSDLKGKLYFKDKTYDSYGENGTPIVVFLTDANVKFVMSISYKDYVCVCDDDNPETMPEIVPLTDSLLKKIIRLYINKYNCSDTETSSINIDSSDLRIIALKYNNNIVGYRIKGSNMSPVDISKASAEKHGVANLKITKVINLVEGKEVLMSSSEKKSGKLCEDISDNDAMIDDFFKKLR